MEKRTNHGKRPSEQLQKLHFFIETRDRKEPPDSPPTPRSSSLLQPTSKHLLQVFAQKWPSRWSSWIIAAGHWSWWDSYFNVACILVWGSCLWGTEQWLDPPAGRGLGAVRQKLPLSSTYSQWFQRSFNASYFKQQFWRGNSNLH